LLGAKKSLTAKLHSSYVKWSESGAGVKVGNFGKVGARDFSAKSLSSDSATLAVIMKKQSEIVL